MTRRGDDWMFWVGLCIVLPIMIAWVAFVVWAIVHVVHAIENGALR